MTLLSVLLGLVPALLLLLALAAGRYPGERVLGRLRASRARTRASLLARRPRPKPRSARRRSGELIAGSLAGRAPPASPA